MNFRFSQVFSKGQMENKKLNTITDPDIFLALKKMCQYIVNVAWNTSTIGVDEYEIEFNLAIARTKHYEQDIRNLAGIDEELDWGEVTLKALDDNRIYKNKPWVNPWYNGVLTIVDLLNSFESLVEQIDSATPQYLPETEFMHYYYFVVSQFRKPIEKTKTQITNITINTLHPKIRTHCLRRFNNSQYPDAILAAYKVVLKEIQEISGIQNLDGKRLVEKAFSLDNPIIKLNPLISQSDKDEQQGFMLLFSGAAVGIRNPKAHDLVIQEDKQKTLRYLAFASLLMERLDERFKPLPENLR